MRSSASTQRFLMTAALDQLPVQRRYLYLFSYLASLTALQILNLALDSMSKNLWLCGALTGGFLYSYYLEPRFRALTTYGVSALAVLVSVFYLLQYQKETLMFGAFLGALLGVLMVLLSFKAFAPNDHRFILMIGVVFLLFSSAACYDLKFMLEMPLFLVFAGCSLYIASQVDVAVRVSQTTGSPVDDRIELGASFVGVLARAIGGIVGLSIIAYILAPHGMRQDRTPALTPPPRVNAEERTDDQARSGTSTPQQQRQDANTGIGDDFDLTERGSLSADPTPVLQVKSHRNGYLRAQVFDVYTGSSWVKSAAMRDQLEQLPLASQSGDIAEAGSTVSSRDPVARRLVPLMDFPSETVLRRLQNRGDIYVPAANAFSLDSTLELDHEIIRQEVRLLKPQPPYYFSMYQPLRLLNLAVEKNSDNLLDEPLADLGSTVRPRDTEQWHPEGFGYTVESIELRSREQDLQQVVLPGPDAIVEHNSRVFTEDSPPPDAQAMTKLGFDALQYRPVSRKLRNFAVSLVDRAAQGRAGKPLATWDKVMAIYDFISDPREFSYSREYQDIDPVGESTEAFVFGTREGYCRQFASAMAVMCRLNGIPARVVSGFAPGTRSIIDNAYIYKASNAHAWVEVYFDGYGWIIFDPTPASRDPHSQPPAAELLRSTVDFLQELFVLDPAGTQQTILSALKDLWAFLLSHLKLSLSALAVLGLSVALALRLRSLPHRRRTPRIAAANEVVAAWLHVLQQLARLGIGTGEGATARVLVRQAGGKLETLQADMAQLLPLYEQAAYSPRRPDEVDDARAWELARHIQARISVELERLREQSRRRY